MTQGAPVEENLLACDVADCGAMLSMPNDIPRERHGWGRITVYNGPATSDAIDYDLCPRHFGRIRRALEQLD